MCPQDYAPLLPPSFAHPLGTDPLGRDALCALLSGVPTSLEVALVSSAVSVVILSLALLLSTSNKGRLAEELADFLVSVPRLPLLVFLALLGSLNPLEIGLLIGLFSSSFGLKAIISEGRRLSRTQFFLASLASGASPFSAWRLHALRNEWRALASYAGLSASVAVYAEAGLAFLGLEEASVASVGKLAFLVFNVPGAVLTEAGVAQVLASALATVTIAYFVYWLWRGPLSKLL